MRRRRFLIGSSATLAWPLIGRAQSSRAAKPFRIGQLPDPDIFYAQLVSDAMRAAGWREGRDFVFVSSGVRYDPAMQEGARRLVEQKVDLILVLSTAHALAAHRASASIPIVMWSSGYPVEAGVAVSLARPGKNVTGMSFYSGTGVWGKLLELLRECKPGIRRVSVPWGYVPPAFPREEIEPCYAELRSAAKALDLSLHIEEISAPERVSAGLNSIESESPDALLITAGPGIWSERQRVMAFAARRRLPTISDFPWPPNDPARPLISYGGSFAEGLRQAVPYVVRILVGGEKPGDLPIQQPAKFELMIDLKTARAIDFTVPRSILARADKVIE